MKRHAPAVILAIIAVPTVKTIFETQRQAPANALTVEVIGHQWWWEFRYPQYGVRRAGANAMRSRMSAQAEGMRG